MLLLNFWRSSYLVLKYLDFWYWIPRTPLVILSLSIFDWIHSINDIILAVNWNSWCFQEIIKTQCIFHFFFFFFVNISVHYPVPLGDNFEFFTILLEKKETTQTVDIILSDSIFCLFNNPPICNSGMVWIISFHFLHSRLQNSHSVYWTQKIQAGDCFYRELHFEMLCLSTGNFCFP